MEHQYTIDELKLLHAAGVPIQFNPDDQWLPLAKLQWDHLAAVYRPDPAALVFRSPEGVLTLGHSREDLLAAQAAGWVLEQFAEDTGWVRWNSRNGWCVSDRFAPYRLAPGQEPWPAPEAKMQALERGEQPKPVLIGCDYATGTYEAWLAARPARLAARKPLAVVQPTKRWREDLDAMTAKEGEANFFHDGTGVYTGAWPIHNPDARMATVPGHEKGMP